MFAQAANAPKIPDTVVAEREVEYSAVGGRQTMDIVRPREASNTPRPAVLLVHGGGFRGGTKEGYISLAVKLAEHGYVAATANYRLAPRNQFPAAVQDVKAAVRFLRANAAKYNLDSDHIGALGGSAGGHLVLMLGLTAGVEEFEGSGPNRDQSSAVQCVVDEYGPTDFTQSYSKSVDAAEVLPKFLGGDLDHERLAHMRSSPLNWVTPNAAPVLAIHGTADNYVAYEQSLWIDRAADRRGRARGTGNHQRRGSRLPGRRCPARRRSRHRVVRQIPEAEARAAHAADFRSRTQRRDRGDRMAIRQSALEGAQRSRA